MSVIHTAIISVVDTPDQIVKPLFEFQDPDKRIKRLSIAVTPASGACSYLVTESGLFMGEFASYDEAKAKYNSIWANN